MTILTGSLTSLTLSGSSLVQRKNTGAEVLMDLDFTKLPNQSLTDDATNSIGGFPFYIDKVSSPEWVNIVNGTGLAFRGTQNKLLRVFLDLTGTFPQIDTTDRIRVVAQYFVTTFGGVGGPGNTIYAGLSNGYVAADEGTQAYDSYVFSYAERNNSVVSDKFIFGAIHSMGGGTAVNTHNVVSPASAAPTIVRLELDGVQDNWYTAGDFNISSSNGLTDFPTPGGITYRTRQRMQTNTSMPRLTNDYVAPFTGSFHVWLQFSPNISEMSASIQRLSIFRYGVDQ